MKKSSKSKSTQNVNAAKIRALRAAAAQRRANAKAARHAKFRKLFMAKAERFTAQADRLAKG